MNLDEGGKEVITKEKRSKNSIQRSIESHEKPILVLNKDGSIYKKFKSGREAVKFFKLKSFSSISNVLRGGCKSCCGYLWVYLDDYDPNKIYTYHLEYLDKRIKTYQFDLKGNLQRVWERFKDFDDNSNEYSENGVRSAIRNKKEYHGSFWSKEDHINPKEFKLSAKYKTDSNYFTSQEALGKHLGMSGSVVYVNLKKSRFHR